MDGNLKLVIVEFSNVPAKVRKQIHFFQHGLSDVLEKSA